MCPSKIKKKENESSSSNSTSNSNSNSNSTKKPHSYYILTPNAVKNLPEYKYDGSDRSPIYKYILSPLAAFMVDKFTPPTVAPNTITLFGLFLMFASYLNIYYHCPTLEQCSVETNTNEDAFPNWIFLVNGIAILCYQTLDNMDGKQARKTNSSSPLGLLFDHGCDAINSIFGSVTWINAFGLSAVIPQHLAPIWIMTFIPMFTFFVTTWEEYYTHKLDLPWINGPTEGLLLGASINFATWWYGRSWWHGDEMFTFISSFLPLNVLDVLTELCSKVGISYPIQNYNLVVFASVLTCVREVSMKVKDIVRVYGIKSIKTLLPMIVLMFWSILIVNSDNEIFVRNERWLFHLVAMLFVEMNTRLMLDHCTGEENRPFRKVLIPFFLLHYVVNDRQLFGVRDVDNYIRLYTMIVFIYMVWYAKTTISEICDVLNIWCFDIVTPRTRSKKKID